MCSGIFLHFPASFPTDISPVMTVWRIRRTLLYIMLCCIHNCAGLLISNIDIDTIDDTFEISVSTILSYKSIDRCIDDTFWPFLSTLHRYFSADMQNDAHNFLSFRAFVRVQRSVEILDERTVRVCVCTIFPLIEAPGFY